MSVCSACWLRKRLHSRWKHLDDVSDQCSSWGSVCTSTRMERSALSQLINACFQFFWTETMLTRQVVDMPTCGLPSCRLVSLRTGQLVAVLVSYWMIKSSPPSLTFTQARKLSKICTIKLPKRMLYSADVSATIRCLHCHNISMARSQH